MKASVGDRTAARIAKVVLEAKESEATPRSHEGEESPRIASARLLGILLEAVDRAGETTENSEIDLGRFRIRRFIGQGGYGLVFEAMDQKLGRAVALKVPQPAIWVCPEERRRFIHEARAAALLDHPNIVPVFEAGEVNGVGYVASAFCAGPTLADWLGRYPDGAPPELSATWVAQLADAVDHAHRRGILHRDIKPSNVLLEPNQVAPGGFVPRLSDFGLARIGEGGKSGSRSRAGMGTPRYMAPEQARGEQGIIGSRADLFSLGVVLYELLTRVNPFARATDVATLRAVVDEEPAPVRRLRPSLSPDLDAICQKCLEKDPRRRYATGADLAADLRRYLAGLPVTARAPSVLERASRWCGRNPNVAALSLGLSLSIVLDLALVTWQWRRAEDHLGRAVRRSEMLVRLVNFAYEADREVDDTPESEGVSAPTPSSESKAARRAALRLRLQEVAKLENILDHAPTEELGKLHARLAELAAEGGLDRDAVQWGKDALGIYRELAAKHPDDVTLRDLVCNHLTRLLHYLVKVEDWRGIRENLPELSDRLLALDANSQGRPRFFARVLKVHLLVQACAAGEDGANELRGLASELATLFAEMARRWPNEPALLAALAAEAAALQEEYRKSGTGRERAIESRRATIGYGESLLRQYPADHMSRLRVAHARVRLARMLLEGGNTDLVKDALVCAQAARGHLDLLWKTSDAGSIPEAEFLRGSVTLAGTFVILRQSAVAIEVAEPAQKRLVEITANKPEAWWANTLLADVYSVMANGYHGLRRLGESLVHFEKARDEWERLRGYGRLIDNDLFRLAKSHYEVGKLKFRFGALEAASESWRAARGLLDICQAKNIRAREAAELSAECGRLLVGELVPPKLLSRLDAR